MVVDHLVDLTSRLGRFDGCMVYFEGIRERCKLGDRFNKGTDIHSSWKLTVTAIITELDVGFTEPGTKRLAGHAM